MMHQKTTHPSFAAKVKADIEAAKRKAEELAKKAIGKIERKKEDKKT